MTDALRLEVKKDSWKQNQDSTYKLTLTLNPADLDDNAQNLLVDFIRAPMGTRYMIGMAEIGDDERAVVKAPVAALEKDTVPFRDRKLSWQAGVRCGDEKFQDFLVERYQHSWMAIVGELDGGPRENVAAELVRELCDVGTRKTFDVSEVAATAWKSLNAEFEEYAGLTAEAR